VTDEALVAEARRGSLVAMEAVVRRHQAVVRGFLRRLTGDPALADDLAQEVFVAAWRRVDAYRGDGTLRSWLCRIAYTQFLQDRRASTARERREAHLVAHAALGDADGALDLDRAMHALSAEQRAAVALCYGEGMSHAEAAEALGMPLGTVKSHVSRGRERLVAALGGGTP
jgi:RNA polymerase sigma-70 factor, ECF subfamily